MTQKNDEPKHIGEVLPQLDLMQPVISRIDARIETLEAQVAALEVGVNTPLISDADRDIESGDIIDGYFNGRLAKLEGQMHSVIRTLETLAEWKRCIERTVDPHGDIDLT